MSSVDWTKLHPELLQRSRATQDDQRESGDALRWGDAVHGQLVVPAAGVATERDVTTRQLVRGQCRDLVAVGWDMIGTGIVKGLDAADLGSLAIEVTIGTGQNTAIFAWLVGSIVAGVLSSPTGTTNMGFAPISDDGCLAVTSSPIVATNIAARGILSVISAVPHTITFQLSLNIAPRVWVP